MASKRTPTSQSDPALGAVAITGSDQTFTVPVRGVYVATAGDLECTMSNDTTATFVGLLAGVIYPFAITAIRDAGTTITGHVLT
jgi:hypothetical protein